MIYLTGDIPRFYTAMEGCCYKGKGLHMKHESLIKQMSLEEKASIMSGKDFWQTVDIERLGIPSITLSDGPHGLNKQAGDADHLGLNASVPATCYPTAATVANSWDPTLGAKIGKHIAQEAIEQGVHVVLGPGLNIKKK
jgi:beta-glucosidase